jgi:hypothetical protein
MAENKLLAVPDNTTPDMTNGQDEQVKLNPFAPESLRLDLNVAEGLGVKKVVATIPVRKPNNQDFIRVHPSPDFRLPVALIELRDEREMYLVRPYIAREIPGEYFAATMYTTINRAGVVFLWPVRLPGTDGRQLTWHTSAAEAAEAAMKGWVRVRADMSLGAYVWWEASSTTPEPTWPKDLTFERMLEIAFKNGRLVESLDHPVLKQLRGET